MFSFSWRGKVLAGSVLIGLMTPIVPVTAQQRSSPPDFSSNFAGWVGLNGGGPFYEPVPGTPSHLSPIVSDPAHPFTPNGTGGQSTYRIPDLSNPNLMPWVKDAHEEGHRRNPHREEGRLHAAIGLSAVRRSLLHGLWRTRPHHLPPDP